MFLKKAGAAVSSSKALSLGSTGLELTGIRLDVDHKESNATIDAGGMVHGVTYTFTLGGGLQTAGTLPGDADARLFKGPVSGSMSTDGNLSLDVKNATIIKYLSLTGSICMINYRDAGAVTDNVCPTRTSPGYYVNGKLSGSFDKVFGACTGHADFTVKADGQFVHSGAGLGYVTATGGGNFTSNLTCGGYKLAAGAKFTGQVGYFHVPGASSDTYGVLLTVSGSIASGSGTIGNGVTIFINANQRVVVNPQNYAPVQGTSDVDVARLGPAAGEPSTAGVAPAGRALRSENRIAAASDAATPFVYKLSPPSVVGVNGCQAAISALLIAQNAPNLAPNPAVRFPEDETTNSIPVFNVSSATTPCIAANDAAAITGTDPSTLQDAVTVSGAGAYGPYQAQPLFSKLTLLQYAPDEATRSNYKDERDKHRAAACGRDPFFPGNKPGPVDLATNPITKEPSRQKPTNGGDGVYFWSCDEFPFASTTNGGSDAIIRGVRLRENNIQGGQLSVFRRTWAKFLQADGGEFFVCVDGKLGDAACPPEPSMP